MRNQTVINHIKKLKQLYIACLDEDPLVYRRAYYFPELKDGLYYAYGSNKELITANSKKKMEKQLKKAFIISKRQELLVGFFEEKQQQ